MTKRRLRLVSLRSLGRDERGSILIQATIIVVVIMGMIGLALDGGRYFMVNNDLQALADAAALAGAAQLDGDTDLGGAMRRAETAARAMGDACVGSSCNNVRWWDVSNVKILPGKNCTTCGVQFAKTLTDLDNNNFATADKDAVYIRVTTGAWQVAPTFLRAVGAISNNSTTARAVAESRSTLCVPASMLLCNPSEVLPGSTASTSSFNPTPGTMFVFHTNGATAFSPGVFSLLQEESPDGAQCNSDQCVKTLLSQQKAGLCTQGGVSPAQGDKRNATINGINVRFDQPSGGGPSVDSIGGIVDPTAAPIVIDGLTPQGRGNSCNNPGTVTPSGFQQTDFDNGVTYDSVCNSSSSPSCPMPRDRTLIPAGGSGSALVGGGPTTADLQAYWNNHHSTSFPTIPANTAPRDYIYQQEVSAGAAGFTSLSNAKETPLPVCPSNLPASTDFKRRRLQVAIVNCGYWGVQGNSVNNIRIDAYADFFLTEPVPCTSCTNKGDIYVEFVDKHTIDQNANLPLRSFVRLVR
jgi:Flp pilus assembly protein TadG